MKTEMKIGYIAKLSRIKLTKSEEARFSRQLSSILDYVKQLNEVNVKNTKPIGSINELLDVYREDEIIPSLSCDKLLQNAPEKKDGFLKVKKVFE